MLKLAISREDKMNQHKVGKGKAKTKPDVGKAVAFFIAVLVCEIAVAVYLFIKNIGMGEMGEFFYHLDRREIVRMSNDSFGAVVFMIVFTLAIGIYLISGMVKASKHKK
jgi:hypothetical protein